MNSTKRNVSDYKNTLNLPQTDFAMRANLPQREPEFLDRWHKIDLYKKITQTGTGRKQFILHDGPPYANGDIHIGHAVNKVLKDIILKSRRLEAYDCPYVPGWDCHGLPIELEVEKKHGKVGAKITLADFYQYCRQYASKQIDKQRQDFIRLGIFGDWHNPYLTMDYKTEADTVRCLATLLSTGYIQRGVKPVHWCLDCRSALAEAEVEYADLAATAVDVLFTLSATDTLGTIFSCDRIPKTSYIGIPIWTTTTWTLAANQAVAVHAEFDYVLVSASIGRQQYCLILEQSLQEQALERYGAKQAQLLGQCKGAALAGLQLRHPLENRNVNLVLGHHVNADTGTGAVHIAPAHGMDDYLIGKRYDLNLSCDVNDNGIYQASVPHVGGMHVTKAAPILLAELNQRGLLLAKVTFQHSYPCCWRHKSGIIFRTTKQWFVTMQEKDLLSRSVDAVTNQVTFEPDKSRARMLSMLKERPDWCISRQRSWGVPIAVFYHKDSGEIHPDTVPLMETIAKKIEHHGIDYWRQSTCDEWLGADAEYYEMSTDIVDVWFDSGVTHNVVLDKRSELKMPADVYIEGSDQHRGWFQSSLLSGMALNDKAPYDCLISHGFVVDEKGHKMSKSKGNVIAPQAIVQKLGADVLRLWVASTDYRDEMRISNEALDRMSDAYRRIRNTARFMLSNLNDFSAETNSVTNKDLLALDRWILHQAARLQKTLREDYQNYQFHQVVQKIHHFCGTDLGSCYLDIIKDRLYTTHTDAKPRRSAQTALYFLITALTRWIAPILSFTAEELWLQLKGEALESVFLAEYSNDLDIFLKADSQLSNKQWQQLMAIREESNRIIGHARDSGVLGANLEADIVLYCDDDLLSLLQKLGEELRFLLISSEARAMSSANIPADITVHQMKLNSDDLKCAMSFQPSTYVKCQRCWHRRAEVKTTAPDDLCERCIANMRPNSTDAEKRLFI